MQEFPLFKEKTLKRLCSDIEVTQKQKNTSKKWIELLENDELREEVTNYPKFMIYILQDLLGYNIITFKHEEKNMEFPFRDKAGNFLVCFEAKGTKTKDLWSSQGRTAKIRETPVNQINDYIYKNKIPYGVLTNYRIFVLFKREEGYTKFHKFDFLDIKDNPEKLKEFILIFSRESFEENRTENIYKESIVEERNFTKEFYKLYHETRLMILREFSERNIEKKLSLHYTQLFLNRLMFIFFAEDTDLLERRYFETKILEVLKSSGIIDNHTDYIFGKIKSIFRELDKEIPKQIKGFNGELFREEIDGRLLFRDYRNKSFFKDVFQNYKLDKRLELNENDKKVFNKHKNKLSRIISNILLMASFDFNTEVNVNILGHIFEQSISDLEELKGEKVLRRKKEGVYYTPDYITEYICRNTIIPYLSKKEVNAVDKLIEEYSDNIGELEEKFKNLKILDPACGSGSFLLKAVEVLLEIHKQIQIVKEMEGQYTAKKVASLSRKQKRAFKDNLQLSFTKWHEENEARKIIENNIFGVDINEESVEITKLSMFLKIATKNRKLIDLSKNIKCGNSLIEDLTLDTKAFDWEKEFPFKFDIVIGNPPYVRQERFKEIKPYLKNNYESFNSVADLYTYFIERGFKLLSEKGKISFILANKFMKTTSGKEIRNFIKTNVNIKLIYDFDDYSVFADATTYPMIFIFDKKKKSDFFIYSKINKTINKNPIETLQTKKIKVSYASLDEKVWNFVDPRSIKIMNKLKSDSVPLMNFVNKKIYLGIKTGRNEAFVINADMKKRLVQKSKKYDELLKPTLTGKEVKRYRCNFIDKYLIFTNYDINIPKEYPDVFEHLKKYEEKLIERYDQGKNWWNLRSCDYYAEVQSPKIIWPAINNQCNFYLDESGKLFMLNNNYFISSDSKSLLALLNSKLIFFYLSSICTSLQGGYYDFRRDKVGTVPVHKDIMKHDVSLSAKAGLIQELFRDIQEKKNRFLRRIKENLYLENITKKLNSFYELEFNQFVKELSNQKIKLNLDQQDEWEKHFIKYKEKILDLKKQISKIDEEINTMIYKLYKLEPEEITIVEDALDS